MTGSCAHTSKERRSVGRERTARRALFGVRGDYSPWAWGRVCDISPSGIQLQSESSLQPGTRIDVEIQPKRGPGRGDSLLVRGKVIWSGLEADGWRCGVHLEVNAPQDAPASFATPADARALLDSLQVALKAEPTSLFAFSAHQAEESVAEAKVTSRNRKMALVALLLFLLLGLSWFVLLILQSPRTGSAAFPGRGGVAAAAVEAVSGVGGPENEINARTAPAWVARAWNLLRAGDNVSAKALFDAVLDLDGIGTGLHASATLGLAEASAMAGDAPAAARALNAGGGGRMPEAWRIAFSRADSSLSAVPPRLTGGPGDTFSLAHRPSVDDVPSPAGRQASNSAPSQNVWLEIDASDYVLRVKEGELTLAEYPVGLGTDGATPLGEFTIANKLLNPTWYDRGRAVAPFSAENPLGGRWLGLADGGVATSYGIHGTRDDHSIGRDQSRGCVRMFKADADALFRMCDVGTVVRIQP